jgi:two-component system sensor histidine kinase YesM
VENALLYGLEPKEEGGVLRIKISQYKDRVRIRILDTGLGMDEQVLAGLKVRDSVPMGIEQGRSIGIKNVMARLRIFFDAQEDFRMYSKPGRGTLVWISFPPGGNGHVQSPDCR